MPEGTENGFSKLRKPTTFNQANTQVHNYFQNGLDIENRTIFLGTTAFSDTSEIQHQDLIDLAKNLHILESMNTGDPDKDIITLNICTFGGDVYTAFGIYDLIKACESPVECRAIGYCMSAGTIIMQAADYRYAYPNTTFMIHKGIIELSAQISVAEGEDLLVESKRITNRLIDIYEETFSIGREEIEEMLNREYFMTASEAAKIGLIDSVESGFCR